LTVTTTLRVLPSAVVMEKVSSTLVPPGSACTLAAALLSEYVQVPVLVSVKLP
jgi:hypothetical protein